jgi:hypothetical protein
MPQQPAETAVVLDSNHTCLLYLPVPAVVLNVDNTCPNNLLNKENVKFLFQAQPKGLVTLDFKQNGDYYISCAVSWWTQRVCN